MDSNSKSRIFAISLGVVFFAALAVVIIWFRKQTVETPSYQIVSTSTAQTVKKEKTDLGSSIYEKAANPISGKLPENTAPVTNPLEGAYKNPFRAR